jgi:hypothetical protein
MISYTGSQLALMDSPAYNVYLQVFIQKLNGERFTFFDYGGIPEDKRIMGATITASVDLATIEGTITFERGIGSLSLSPYIGGSFFNVGIPCLHPGNVVTLWCAIVPQGATPAFSDWRTLLDGRIDQVNVNAGPDTVSVRFRDAGGLLLNQWIEAPNPYGSEAGTLAEDVIQDILADSLGAFPQVGIISPGADSGFMIRQYMQERMPVLEAVRRIAQQIGWEVRHYPRLGQGTLAFQDPGRNREPQFTIHPDLYLGVNKLEVSDDDVRNVWRIGYPGAPGEPPSLFVTVEDAASIAQYGRRFAEIVEDRSSNIDTLEEATTMATLALADTKDPLADFGIDLLPCPFVELNDVYTFAANGVHHDSDQVWSVAGYNHDFKDGSGRTQIFTRGKPIAAYRDYRRGVRRKTHISLEDAPTETYLDGIDYPEGTLWLKTPSYAFPVP